jgi:hypothetical protein
LLTDLGPMLNGSGEQDGGAAQLAALASLRDHKDQLLEELEACYNYPQECDLLSAAKYLFSWLAIDGDFQVLEKHY